MPDDKKWIDDLEIADAQVKWAWSHMDGRADLYNEEGDHNFILILDQTTAARALEDGWAIREKEAPDEGDPPELQLKCKISDKFGMPKIYLIKGDRKMRAEMRDLADINRATCKRIDVILTPSRWVSANGTGITAYVKEMYATVNESRFAADYADLDEV